MKYINRFLFIILLAATVSCEPPVTFPACATGDHRPVWLTAHTWTAASAYINEEDVTAELIQDGNDAIADRTYESDSTYTYTPRAGGGLIDAGTYVLERNYTEIFTRSTLTQQTRREVLRDLCPSNMQIWITTNVFNQPDVQVVLNFVPK